MDCTCDSFFDPKRKICVRQCPRGTFPEFKNGLKNCVDHRRDTAGEVLAVSELDQLRLKIDFFFVKLKFGDIEPFRFLLMITNKKCKPCHSSCDRCFGPTAGDCDQPVLKRGKDDITAGPVFRFSGNFSTSKILILSGTSVLVVLIVGVLIFIFHRNR